MTVVTAEPVSLVRSQHGWLSWAAFLGMSWTWCIGMFLPVILVRDYGLWGWIVFAVPNVLGAAAMGWVIGSRESSQRIVANHHLACTVFSGVTIAFHLFFVVAVIAPLAHSMVQARSGSGAANQALDLAAGGMIGAAVLLYLYMTRRPDGDRTLAWITLLISTGVIICMFSDLMSPTLGMARMTSLRGSEHSDLIWLAPVCLFGFLTCPYLDLTFHRARQASQHPKASFGVGFGGMFLPMIVFTLLYAQAMTNGSMTRWIAALLYIHLAVQSAFTVAAHARELQENGQIASVLAGVLAVLSIWAFWNLEILGVRSNIGEGELIYRSFMGFYGLVFPAYVWLVMLPGRGSVRPTAGRLVVYWGAVIGALPMFTLGFLLQKPGWLLPGLGVVLLARLAIRPVLPRDLTGDANPLQPS